MYRVLIVDDEMLVRKRIMYGFDWESLGYEVVDDVDNGYDGLRLIEEKGYDLAIVDIAMPGINGIQVVQAVREKHIPLHIIFLTGHSEFKYAQEAVRFGVYDYILKPVDEREFIEILKKLAVQMEEDRRKKALESRATAVIESKTFSDLFHDTMSGEEIEESRKLLEQYGIGNDIQYYVALYQIDQSLKEGRSGLWGERVAKLIRTYIGSVEHELIIYDIYRDYIIALIEVELYEEENDKIICFEKVRKSIADELKSDVRCGVSKSNIGHGRLRKAYVEAVSALNNAKVLTQETMSFAMVEEQGESSYKIPEDQIKNLHTQLGKSDFNACKVVIREIFHDLFNGENSFECIVTNVDRMFLKLLDMGVISELEMKWFMNGGYNFEEVFDNMSGVNEVIDWFEQIVFALLENSIRASTETKSLSIIEKTCSYIQTHFREVGLSQSEIADAMGVTQPYISGIFKKMVGISMVQYITKVRMEKAREILLQGEVDIRTASEQIGYGDEYYFSRCFKKYYGVSPLQMKKMVEAKRIAKNSRE